MWEAFLKSGDGHHFTVLGSSQGKSLGPDVVMRFIYEPQDYLGQRYASVHTQLVIVNEATDEGVVVPENAGIHGLVLQAESHKFDGPMSFHEYTQGLVDWILEKDAPVSRNIVFGNGLYLSDPNAVFAKMLSTYVSAYAAQGHPASSFTMGKLVYDGSAKDAKQGDKHPIRVYSGEPSTIDKILSDYYRQMEHVDLF